MLRCQRDIGLVLQRAWIREEFRDVKEILETAKMVKCLRVLISHDKFWWKSQTSLTALKSPMSSMVDSQRKPSLTNNCMLITTNLVGGWQQLFGELGFLSESSSTENIGDVVAGTASGYCQSSKPQSQTGWHNSSTYFIQIPWRGGLFKSGREIARFRKEA